MRKTVPNNVAVGEHYQVRNAIRSGVYLSAAEKDSRN